MISLQGCQCSHIVTRRVQHGTCESAGTPPPARSAHAAAAYQNRFLLIFGGGSVANCYGDLHVLDTETMHWSQPATAGPAPSPRAGMLWSPEHATVQTSTISDMPGMRMHTPLHSTPLVNKHDEHEPGD